MYRPPDTSKYLPQDFNKILDDILSTTSSESKEIILLGDVNVNYLDKKCNIEFKSILNLYGLKQLIKNPTRIDKNSKTLIDIIATNSPSSTIRDTKVIPSSIGDHEMIGCIRKQNFLKFQPKYITCRDYRNYNQNTLCTEIKTNRD